jgi:Fur family zinc uptake transcriptional regulator
MNPSLEKRLVQAKQLCEQAGVRLTDIRKNLLALIYTHDEHLTAYELLRLLRETYPKAEAMTVYRGLSFLQEQKLIHRVASQNAYTACDTPEHIHHAQLLLCEKCGQAEEINATALEKALQTTAKFYHFHLSNSPIEISGICKNCKN